MGRYAQYLRVRACYLRIASTFVAITAVEKIKAKELDRSLVEINEGAGAYILEPFAQHIIREATQAAERTAADTIEKAAEKATKHESRPELKVVREA
jgi:hypothetical protein